MGVNSLAILPDRPALAGTATDSTNREVVMLLQLHVHVTLVQDELTALVQLLVEGLVMVVDVHLRQVVEEAAVSVTGLRVVEPFLSLILSLRSQRHRLRGRLPVAGAQPLLLQLSVVVRELPSISRFHVGLRTHAPALRGCGLHGCLAGVSHEILCDDVGFSVFAHVIVRQLGSHACVGTDRLQVLPRAKRLLV